MLWHLGLVEETWSRQWRQGTALIWARQQTDWLVMWVRGDDWLIEVGEVTNKATPCPSRCWPVTDNNPWLLLHFLHLLSLFLSGFCPPRHPLLRDLTPPTHTHTLTLHVLTLSLSISLLWESYFAYVHLTASTLNSWCAKYWKVRQIVWLSLSVSLSYFTLHIRSLTETKWQVTVLYCMWQRP